MVVADANGSTYKPTVVAQVRYMLQWFGEWSEMERGDFLPVMVHGFGCNGSAANGLLSIIETLCKVEGRPLSLFKCRIKLFTEWVPTWSDEDKDSFLSGIRSVDADFAERYDQKAVDYVVSSPEHCNGINGDKSPDELPDDELPEETI